MIKWCLIDDGYINFLKKIDTRIPNVNYGSNHIKPFFSPLFEKDGLVYVVAISSAKPKHTHMTEQLYFFKLYSKKNQLISVINLNYMFPVPKNKIINFSYKDIDNYCKFPNNKRKSQYINFLKIELKAIKNKDIPVKAKNLYNIICSSTKETTITRKCLNFLEIEKQVQEAIKNKKI